MTTKPKKSANASNLKVQAIRPAAQAVEPPEGWVLQSDFGFMRFDASPAGMLVRLADVLRWLALSRALPRAEALDVLCGAMPRDVLQFLYLVQPSAYAKPVPVNSMFGYQTAQQIEAKKARQNAAILQTPARYSATNWGGVESSSFERPRIHATLPAPTEPGLPALLKLLHRWWTQSKLSRQSACDILDDPKAVPLVNLAIRMDKAFELWGYGRLAGVETKIETIQVPKNWAELVQFRKTHTGTSWTPEMKQILGSHETAEKKKPASKGVREAMAVELGITSKRVGELIRELATPNKNQRTGTR